MGRRGRTVPTPLVSKRCVKNVLSNEDWYPTTGGVVRVSLIEYSDGHARVCVWGGDDFGLELDFPKGSPRKARAEFKRIVNLTTQAELRSRGFINA